MEINEKIDEIIQQAKEAEEANRGLRLYDWYEIHGK